MGENRECRGTCKYHIPGEIPGEGDWICNNGEAEECALETEYSCCCEMDEEILKNFIIDMNVLARVIQLFAIQLFIIGVILLVTIIGYMYKADDDMVCNNGEAEKYTLETECSYFCEMYEKKE